MSHIAFLGTGLLGSGMVEAMRRRGEPVVVWNRTASKAEALEAHGAKAAASPADAVRGASRVHLCLSEDLAVDAVLDEVVELLRGVPVIDHSTSAPAGVAARMARMEMLGVPYLPAPVFMGPQNARDATGLMLASGPKERFDQLEPFLAPMTGKVWYVGDRADQAAVYKLFGNAAIISMVGVLGDIFQLARASDLPPAAAMEVLTALNPGGFLTARGPKIAAGKFSPASFELGMARKDVRLMIEACGELPLMVLPGIAAHMDSHLQAGDGSLDFSVIASG